MPQTQDWLADDLVGAACSFSGATLVLMVDGSRKPIEDVELGDMVLATDPDTGETAAREVTHLRVYRDTVVDPVVDGEVITTTQDHPFWNESDREWQRADGLDVEDLVRSASGRLLEVQGLEELSVRTAPAYNLTVDDIHTYYVGAGDDSVLVRNTCGIPRGRRLKTSSRGRAPSIQRVKLPKGSPPWSDFRSMEWGDILDGAKQNLPGFRTAKKVLEQARF